MPILFKAIYRFNAIPIKIPMAFFTELEQIILTCVWNHRRPWIAKAILRKKEQNWRDHTPWLQIILQSSSNQNSMVLAQKQTYNTAQWNRTVSPEINPHTFGQLIYNKEGKNIQWGKDSPFNKWYWENWTDTCKTMRLEHSLTPYSEITQNGLNT